jgi:putative spermidine/putrescine transport system permease protein
MFLSRPARILLRFVTVAGLVFLYAPLVIIAVLSFNSARTFSWPPEGLTLHWWTSAFATSGPRDALWTSVKTALGATAVALVLGTMASLAVQRFRFFGRETVSFLVILPIALPGIVTGIALNAAFRQAGVELGLLTLIVAHATFCIVVVYNNVIARLRRMSPNLEEASADLGADMLQTFRYVTFPLVRSALLAGALLAFALSFDEIVVTTFTAGAGIETLPQWIFNNLFRPNQLPVVNVVATTVVLASVIPVWLAQRLTEGSAGVAPP